MERRLYFLAPDTPAAALVVDELNKASIPAERIHAIGRDENSLGALPPATVQQKRDVLHTIQRIFWNGNLAVFGLALLALLIALYTGHPGLAALCLAIMIGTFALGLLNTRLPDVQLQEFRSALRHGEILVFADVPKERVQEVEDLVHRRHPEVTVGGVGWTIGALGV